MTTPSAYFAAQLTSLVQLDALLAAKGKKIESVIDLRVDDEVCAVFER